MNDKTINTAALESNTIAKVTPEGQSESTAMISMIERAAMNPDVDIDKMERLLSMQEKIINKQAESAYSAAMTAAQGDMKRVQADCTNPQTRSNYASYAAIDKALRPVYTRHGFSLSFDTDTSPMDECIRVICHVSHSDGHTRTHHVDMPADGKGAKGNAVMTRTHAAGSAMSYGMRYLLKMIFNVAIGEDDDDGNEASSNVERITENQAADIKALIDEVGANEFKLLQWLKLKSIDEIPASQHAYVVGALEEKRGA